MELNHYLQVTSGQGPTECCWVAYQVTQLLLSEADIKGLKYSIVHVEPKKHQHDQYRSALISLAGKNAKIFCESWQGVILWRGQSIFRPRHNRKNWYIGVNYFCSSHMSKSRLKIEDIDFQAVRASGAGGQHVNKTNSAVIAVHRPTGLQVKVSDERSQHRNKRIAIERLRARLAIQLAELTSQQQSTQWLSHWQLERGNPSRRYEGFPLKPLTTGGFR